MGPITVIPLNKTTRSGSGSSANGRPQVSDTFQIESGDWWGTLDGEDPGEICRCAIAMRAGDAWLTRLEDFSGGTVRKRMHGSAYPLACWFAGNWWRLRWEPEVHDWQSDVDWRMSHSLASAGGGYSWPDVLFASDGESIAVAAEPGQGRVMGPVRYLSSARARITAKDFEREVDAFVLRVLSRLHSAGRAGSDLAALWEEVVTERNDPALARWRRLEAICGYDPAEAPSSLIELISEDRFGLGKQAVEEVAAHARHQTAQTLEAIRDLAASGRKPREGGYRCRPLTLKARPRYQPGMRPWEKASRLARAARQEWGLDDEVVSNMRLAEIMHVNERVFSTRGKAAAPLPLALRDSAGENVDLYMSRNPVTSRRFAACRLLGQWLESNGKTERLIPASDARTAQQQFQRAFAQEFLCPFTALVSRLQTEHPTPEQIEDAAAHFGVSSVFVRMTLVNKGELDREALRWSE